MSSNISFRVWEDSDQDYEDWVAIQNSVVPEYSISATEMRTWEERRDPKCKQQRWFALADGELVGAGSYSQNPWIYHPQRFEIQVGVPPQFEGNGYGKALYNHIVDAVQEHAPISFRCKIREDWKRGHQFALDRGYVEDFREWESRLPVAPFDMTPFMERYHEPEKHGIVIKTAGQLKAEDPEFYPKWYDLDCDASRDVPSPEPQTFPEFDRWLKWFEDNPRVNWDSIFLAVDTNTGEYAGVTSLWPRDMDSDLGTGFTGVRRSQRRKGIAFALKLRAIEYAKSVNCPTIRTDNASTNRPMLSINEALGFIKQPAWISLAKSLEPNNAV